MNRRSHKKSKKRGNLKHSSNSKKSDESGKENVEPLDGVIENHSTEINNNCKANDGEYQETFKIKSSEIMGRYLVAAKDLDPGDIIIAASPLAIGPCTGCDISCLGCYQKLRDTINTCDNCGWPLCSNNCSGKHTPFGHSIEECKTLKKPGPPNYDNVGQLKDLYIAITPLRCLLLREHDPVKWKQLHEMVAHNEIRRSLTEVWKFNQRNVVDRIIKHWRITDYDEELIHTVCGILEVNAFEIGQHGVSIRGVFPVAYLIAHDCVPNTTHTDNDDHTLTVRASNRINKGDMISLSYAYTLQGTLKRREHLKHSKFFECCCRRCKDPTELGTFVSALNCPKCSSGRVLPLDPLSEQSSWKCNNENDSECPGYNVTAGAVKMLLERLTDEYDSIDANDVTSFENFLQKYRNVLHSNHYLFVSVKHSLSQLYGKTADYMIQDMSDSNLKRKIEICKSLMTTFDLLEPGYSRLRGITLYELHAPIMILITREFGAKTISKLSLKYRLKEVANCLKESSAILNLEPKNSTEGVIASAAMKALTRIKDWEKIIGKI